MAVISHIILSLLLALQVAVMSSHQPSPHERTKSRSYPTVGYTCVNEQCLKVSSSNPEIKAANLYIYIFGVAL